MRTVDLQRRFRKRERNPRHASQPRVFRFAFSHNAPRFSQSMVQAQPPKPPTRVHQDPRSNQHRPSHFLSWPAPQRDVLHTGRSGRRIRSNGSLSDFGRKAPGSCVCVCHCRRLDAAGARRGIASRLRASAPVSRKLPFDSHSRRRDRRRGFFRPRDAYPSGLANSASGFD